MRLFEEKIVEDMEIIDITPYVKKIRNIIQKSTTVTTENKQQLIKKNDKAESCIIDIILTPRLTLSIKQEYEDTLKNLNQLYREVSASGLDLKTAIWICNFIIRLQYVALCNAIIAHGTLIQLDDPRSVDNHVLYRGSHGQFVVLSDFTLVAPNPIEIMKNLTSIFDEEVYTITNSNGADGVRFFDGLFDSPSA